MGRRCDRPGCSEPAAVAYGFDASSRLVWLDRLLDDDRARSGALCLRHAQRLTAPKGWWLDDRRVEVPGLFRDGEAVADAQPSAEPPKPRRQRRPRKPRPVNELVAELVAEPVVESAVEPVVGPALEPVVEPGAPDTLVPYVDVPYADFDEDVAAAGTMVVEETVVVEDAVDLVVEGDVVLEEAIVLEEPDVAEPNPLLEPSSPLLARAFTGVARTDGPRRRSRRNGTAHPPAEPAG